MSVDPAAATVPAPAAWALSPGDLIAERYRIDAVLGRGAMGVVYRVEHIYIHKRFALKVLDGPWSATPGAVERFEREAIAASHIGDPHVVHATDFGRLADGSFFLLLEYVDGCTLRSALDRGAFKPRRAITIARGIVSAIEAAHAAGVIHRDLKPENIMLVEHEGNPDYVKVLDFGIAAFDRRAPFASSEVLTHRGAPMGTPYYMAPEQVTGEPADARSDLYSTGVILFEMLTGQPPFLGDQVSVLRGHMLDEPPALPKSVLDAAGEPVGAIVRRLLAKEPEARFPTARELAVALDEWLAAFKSRRATVPSIADASSALRTHVGGAMEPLRAALVRSAPSVLTWPRAILARVRARRRRGRIRAALMWPKGLVSRLRAWSGRRRLRASMEALAAHARRSSKSLARAASRLPRRRVALGVAIGVALLAVVLCWPSTTSGPTTRPSAPSAPTRGPMPRRHL